MDGDKLPPSREEIRERMIISFMENTSFSREEAKTFLESHQWNIITAVADFIDKSFANAIAAGEANVTNSNNTQLPSTVATRTRNPFSKRGAYKPSESERNKRRELAGNKPAVAENFGGSNDRDSDDYDEGEQSGTMIMQESEEDEERPVRSSSRIPFTIVSAEPQVVILFIVTIWRNGFTVNKGPLHTMDNPQNTAFIEFVQRLESPRDLNPNDNHIRHRITLISRQEEDFSESPWTPFQGVGRTLGGSDSAATEPPASSESMTTTTLPTMRQVVDTTAPITSIHDTATTLQLCFLYSGAKTILQEPKEGEDVDDKGKESDVEMPLQSLSRPNLRIVSAEPEIVILSTITIWRNGFTMDDHAYLLHMMDDPTNIKAFIEYVQGLESPRDFNPQDNQIRYRIKLIRRGEEDFDESPKFTPFQGVGRILGGSDSAITETPASSDLLNTTTPPPVNLVVDPAAPITSIQIRLADGSLISSQFNTHHTVRDVRGFIDASRPGGSNDYYLLIMGIPPKPLLDFDQTIENAGISNSVLIQFFVPFG